MLVHNEQIVHEYLMWAVCGEPAQHSQNGRDHIECFVDAFADTMHLAAAARADRAVRLDDLSQRGRCLGNAPLLRRAGLRNPFGKTLGFTASSSLAAGSGGGMVLAARSPSPSAI
jgi:hypothetical protein